ncbi:MAG: MFS transporter [Phycisphaerae bacterium]|nr:MFS transporter [Phycisphaerae bacterium]
MPRWLNKNVFAFGLTSFLSDFCHEMATAVLPQFMQVIGSSAAALGSIEGIADALSSFIKLGAGFHSDRIGHRKAWSVMGHRLGYEKSCGLCIPHLMKGMEYFEDISILKYLYETEIDQLETVKTNTASFIKKMDPPLRWEQTEDEQKSWYRAIEKMVGRSGA